MSNQLILNLSLCHRVKYCQLKYTKYASNYVYTQYYTFLAFYIYTHCFHTIFANPKRQNWIWRRDVDEVPRKTKFEATQRRHAERSSISYVLYVLLHHLINRLLCTFVAVLIQFGVWVFAFTEEEAPETRVCRLSKNSAEGLLAEAYASLLIDLCICILIQLRKLHLDLAIRLKSWRHPKTDARFTVVRFFASHNDPKHHPGYTHTTYTIQVYMFLH